MLRMIASCVVVLSLATSACAQTAAIDPDHVTGSHEGTVACRTEEAMVALMKASPGLTTNEEVLQRLIKSGDCLVMPDGWVVLRAEDPPLNQQADHASRWTVRTPEGIVHMWGTPFGGD